MKQTQVGLPTQKQTAPGVKWVVNLLIFFFIMVVVSAITTQYMAAQLGYHASLGGDIYPRYYWPWMWGLWLLDWWNTYPALMQRIMLFFTGGTALALGVYVLFMLMLRKGSKGVAGLHGTARWANKADIVQAGLLPANPDQPVRGVYVGGWKDPRGQVHYLTHDGAEHVLAFAPTRSGKGVGLVLPTLLSWTGSVLCYDIKGENWALTAGWRRKHADNIVMKFDPASEAEGGVKFNPLAEIRLDTNHDVADAQNIAMMIVDPHGEGLKDHWVKTGFALTTAAILHVCYVKKTAGQCANLADVAGLLADPTKKVLDVLEGMLTFPHRNNAPHEVIAQEAQAMAQKAENERSGVISTVRSNLTLYLDPIVKKNIATSDFKIKDLMNHDQPVSLYLVVKPSDAERLRPLIRLLITQIIKTLTDSMEFENGRVKVSYQHRLLLMLDEFASLKKLPVMEDALAFMAGYGLKAYLIVQDLEQIKNAYGKYEGVLGNCHIKIAYAPSKPETAEVLSKMTGVTTIIKKQTTASGKKHGVMLGGMSETYSEVSRPLLTPDEVQQLPGAKKEVSQVVKAGDMLVFAAGFPAIYGTQILYFIDPVFSARANVPAPPVSGRTRETPQTERAAAASVSPLAPIRQVV